MAGRHKIFDEQEVLARATEVFRTKGFEAASTEELLAAMGIGKGSFYHTFQGGKKELFEKVLDHFNSLALGRLRKELQESKDPVGRIKNFFLEIAHTPKSEHSKGCFLGNTIAELSNIDNQLKNHSVKLLRQLEQLFEEVIRQAQSRGELKTKEDPSLLAHYLINLWNGLNITRRMHPQAEVLKPLIELQLKILT